MIRIEKQYSSDREENKNRKHILRRMKCFIEAKLNQSKSSIESISSVNQSKLSHEMTLDRVAEILALPTQDRTQRDYNEIHKFMVENVDFFKPRPTMNELEKRRSNKLSREDKMNMYEVMQYKMFKKGQDLCKFGRWGNCFFIILEGKVGVRGP